MKKIFLRNIIIPAIISAVFIYNQKMWVIIIFELYAICMILNSKSKENVGNCIQAMIFFSMSIFGICLKSLFLNIYREYIYNAGMFIIGLFIIGLMVLIQMFVGAGVIYVKNKRKKRYI